MASPTVESAGAMLADPKAYTDESRLHAGLAQLRANAPVSWVEVPEYAPFWAITKHADIMEIERANDIFTNSPRPVLTTREGDEQQAALGIRTLIHADDPLHRDLRAILDGWPGEVHVETNSTIRPPEWMLHRIAHWTVSPKLANAATKAARLNANPLDWGVLARLGRASVKFVAVTPGDLDEAATWVDMGSIPREAVWIMPEGTDGATVVATARLLADDVAARGWNLTLRQQVLLYGRERAR